MSLIFKDNQTDKKALQVKDKANQVKQGSEAKKTFEKVKKKKNSYYKQFKRPSLTTIEAHATTAISGKGQ